MTLLRETLTWIFVYIIFFYWIHRYWYICTVDIIRQKTFLCVPHSGKKLRRTMRQGACAEVSEADPATSGECFDWMFWLQFCAWKLFSLPQAEVIWERVFLSPNYSGSGAWTSNKLVRSNVCLKTRNKTWLFWTCNLRPASPFIWHGSNLESRAAQPL